MFTDVALRMLIALQRACAWSRGERGQTLAEYSLIISAIAVAAVTIAVITFREALVGAWNSAIPCLDGSC
jgi:Flp pilus assembly pilin Flp